MTNPVRALEPNAAQAAGPRMQAPSAARNRDAILHVLRPHLPASGLVLEVASGTGEHVAHLAAAIPALRWQPTDLDAERRASIDAWASGLGNVLPALPLDAAEWPWPVARADAVLCINMIHIAPWRAACGLLSGAGRTLQPGGLLALYGPFRQDGAALGPGNAAFDADLRAADPGWGLRLLEVVAGLAGAAGFGPATVLEMPVDNRLVLFRRRASSAGAMDQASR